MWPANTQIRRSKAPSKSDVVMWVSQTDGQRMKTRISLHSWSVKQTEVRESARSAARVQTRPATTIPWAGTTATAWSSTGLKDESSTNSGDETSRHAPFCGCESGQLASITIATAFPPPRQRLAKPRFLPVRRKAYMRLTSTLAPLAPMG